MIARAEAAGLARVLPIARGHQGARGRGRSPISRRSAPRAPSPSRTTACRSWTPSIMRRALDGRARRRRAGDRARGGSRPRLRRRHARGRRRGAARSPRHAGGRPRATMVARDCALAARDRRAPARRAHQHRGRGRGDPRRARRRRRRSPPRSTPHHFTLDAEAVARARHARQDGPAAPQPRRRRGGARRRSPTARST